MKKGTKEEAFGYIKRDLKMIEDGNTWLRNSVRMARERGASWAEIGEVLGVTRQSAHERFGGAGEPSDG